MNSGDRLAWLDFARGIAALTVCMGHVRSALFMDYVDLPDAGLATSLFYAWTGLGREAVMVFFVLSGFLVGGAVMRAGTAFDWRTYAIARLSRLWVVLVPALLLTAALDTCVAYSWPSILSGSHYADWQSGPAPQGLYAKDWLTALGNLLFLQTLLVPVFGTNTPLWSLANESWYYLWFPLAASAAGALGGRASWRIAAGMAAIGIALLLPASFATGLLVWLMGCGAAFIATRHRIARPASVASLAALALLGVLALGRSSPRELNDVLIGVTTAFFCAAAAFLPHRWPRWIQTPTRALSEMSYSLYLSHFPVVVLIASASGANGQGKPCSATLLWFFGWLGLLLAVAGTLWWLFERRTPEVRRFLQRRLLTTPR